MENLAARCGFEDLSQVDHFMNYVYWKYVKGRPAPGGPTITAL